MLEKLFESEFIFIPGLTILDSLLSNLLPILYCSNMTIVQPNLSTAFCIYGFIYASPTPPINT